MTIVLITGGAAALVSIWGAWLLRHREAWTRRYSADIMAVAAGFILGGVFFHFLPELAHEGSPGLFAHMGMAFLLLHVLQHHFAPHFHLTEAETPEVMHAALGWVAALAFVVHAAFDGLSIGVGFAAHVELGMAAFLAVLAHKLPEGVVIYTLFVRGGHPPTRAFRVVVAVALVTPFAAVLGYLGGNVEAFLPLGLAWSAGALLYIGASDLLPEIAHFPGWRRTLLLLAGVMLIYLLSTLPIPH